MSMPVNLSNDIYYELKRIKEKENKSFSEVIDELLDVRKAQQPVKTKGTKELLEFINKLEQETPWPVKKVNYVDLIDEIAYG